MEFLKDDGIIFCSFFDIKAINTKEGNMYLNTIKENEKVMILYTREKTENAPKFKKISFTSCK